MLQDNSHLFYNSASVLYAMTYKSTHKMCYVNLDKYHFVILDSDLSSDGGDDDEKLISIETSTTEPQFVNNLITNPFHSTCGDDDKLSSMLTSEPQYDFINNLDSEQFNSSGGDDDKLSTINISMSTSEPQLSRQSIENFNNLFTDEQYYEQF